jgi:hypothetical protein
MSTRIVNNERKIDLANLGQFYRPINFFNYCPGQASLEAKDLPQDNPKVGKKIENLSCSPNVVNNAKTLKVKFENISNGINESFGKKNTNNSYNVSRNDNNMNENTTLSTMDDKNINCSIEEKTKMNKIKELMTCFLCHEKVIKPKICPNCFKIACEECLKKWFINKNNKKCFFCHKDITLEKMIFIPVINNISNILNKITCDIKNDSSLVFKQLNPKKTYNNLNNINKNNNVEPNKSNISCNTTGNLMKKSTNNSLDLRNCYKKVKRRKFPNSIGESPFSYASKKETTYSENCQTHPDQLLFYYCVDCEKSYCRTCFVFFGQEKNNHNGHQIIDYEKFKNKNNFELMEAIKDLKENNIKINFLINQCECLKNCYLNEKEIVNNYIKSFIKNYNEKIEENIKKINDIINNYKKYIQQINKTRENIKKYYSTINDINQASLIKEIKKVNSMEYTKSIDSFADLSPKFFFNTYLSDLMSYNIIDKNFRLKTKLGDSKYNLVVLRKENEIQIYIYYPVEKGTKIKKSILPYIYLKKKDDNWEMFELKEFLTYNGHNYFIKRYDAETFCPINSYIIIKGVLYENFFV